MNAAPAHFTVALLAFDGMEALDFAGPFEVFTTASRVHARTGNTEAPFGIADNPISESAKALFDVKSYAITCEAVQARAGLRVLPDADFTSPPVADLLLVPGGVVDRARHCAATLAWVRRLHGNSRWTASVCTGAFILAAAGVLTDQPVTTHWEDLVDLQQQFPALDVRSGARWVATGGERLVTSAGISAGIDMSLHLVATMAGTLGYDGMALAERTARQMDHAWTRHP